MIYAAVLSMEMVFFQVLFCGSLELTELKS